MIYTLNIIFCELIECVFISLQVENAVEYVDGMLKPSLSHLKYCCLVNIGNLKLKENNCKAALKYFLQVYIKSGLCIFI